MRFTSLRIAGFRGFNEVQTIDLSGPLVVFEGPNGSGKTSIGEALEWLLYGKTLKRAKGEELSKREYTGSYKNTHFTGPGLPFVEAQLEDLSGKVRMIRRELKADETSSLTVDGAPAPGLRAFGVDTLYDRPLILQHTLQDFIFMKPKARYEVLSAMMGLESLITFRNTVESAKTEFGKRLPQGAVQAKSRQVLLLAELRQEEVLSPIAALIEGGKLAEARRHVEQVAEGLVPLGTSESDFVQLLKSIKAAKERAQLDWGKFSASVINTPADTPAVRQLVAVQGRVKNLLELLAKAQAATARTRAPQREQDPNRRQFYELGLHFLDRENPAHCPFCATDSLTPERVAAIREAARESPAGLSAIQQVQAELHGFASDLRDQMGEVSKLVPSRPEAEDVQKIQDIGGLSAGAFLASNEALAAHLDAISDAFRRVDVSRKAVETALTTDTIPAGSHDLAEAVAEYSAAVSELPAVLNAYAANYNLLEPAIRAGLASAADVKKIERTTKALEQWEDVVIAQAAREVDQAFGDLIRDIRDFTGKKQKEVLRCRDQEVKDWYGMLNPASDVAYDGIVPGTDNLELRARTFTKTMAAAPNLSSSQLNCVGIAVYLACATRPGTPFRTLLIDDPVQSMDDEHTEAFKKRVISKLLTDGYHVIVLTHMQLLGSDIESLYRKRGAIRYKMSGYTRSGPCIDWKGPEIGRLLDAVRKNKDSTNEEYRKQATLDLRTFIETFVKDLFKAETQGTVSRRYEDKAWGELRELLRRCPHFETDDEPKLEDTHSFTSRHLHTDDRMPQRVPGAPQITVHYQEMSQLLDKYKQLLGIR